MYTPLSKTEPKQLKIHSVDFSLNMHVRYWMRVSCAILIGFILKLIYPLEASKIGKLSYLTGVPFLRAYFFLIPIILSVLFLLWLIVIYRGHIELQRSSYDSMLHFLKKLRFGYIFSNFAILLCFYIVYYKLYIPLDDIIGIKLSGHILACILSGAILNNSQQLCQAFTNQNVKKDLMGYVSLIANVILFHNVYTVVWTSWVYHHMRELCISLIISVGYICIIQMLSLDRIIGSILNREGPKRKEKNLLFTNNTEFN